MKRLFAGPSSVCLAKVHLRLLRLIIGSIAFSPVGICTGILLLDSVIAPAVQAYTATDLLTVSRVAGENYAALSQRAESAARSLAQQRFDSDILLTGVNITVLGQNGGQTAPILVLNVNRNDWRRRPDPRYWATYYRSTPALLGLSGSAPVQPTQSLAPTNPAPANPPATMPTPTPANSPVPNRTRSVSPLPNQAAPADSTPDVPDSPSQVQNSPPSRATRPTRSTGSLTLPAGESGVPRSILRYP